MASCGLKHIFDNVPLPENPTLLESLSPWNQLKKVKSLDHHHHQPSFTEIFGELHFKEPSYDGGCHKRSESFSTESLQMCTEGLGVESSAGMVEDFEEKDGDSSRKNIPTELIRRTRVSGGGGFPPPISCIGKGGKPWVSFKPYRKDGRFMLKEVRIPTQDVLEACREDGRLKLHFVHQDDETLEENDDNNNDNEEEQEIEDAEDLDDDSDEEKEENKAEAIHST